MDPIASLALIVLVWFVFYGTLKLLKVERPDLEISPFYALFKSTKLNSFITRLATWNPGFWRILGNIGVVLSIGEAAFATWLLGGNLLRFLFLPGEATPVQPLIPGVTIGIQSLPWFLLAAGIVILTHELSHGIQCVLEGIKVKSSAILVAVITFGGAVEPDEEELKAAPLMSKLRVFASGSVVNLILGLFILALLISVGKYIPPQLNIFFSWLYFVSVNLAIMNMLPIGPLDGGQMWRALTLDMKMGKNLQAIATYGFIALIMGNIIFSMSIFGLIPL
jgi:membrane-associated protease RseP (regulator of RpoE activity)